MSNEKAKHVRKSHNVSLLMYHFVCPAKYRRVVFSKDVDITLKNICSRISKTHDIHFLEIGTDNDHVHFLLQSVPMLSASKIIQTIKSLIAREIFKVHPEVKKQLWGGEFWTKGFYVNTVGQNNSEDVIRNYVKNQGKESDYCSLYKNQMTLKEFL